MTDTDLQKSAVEPPEPTSVDSPDVPQPKRSWKKRLLVNLLSMAGATAFAILVAEIALRVYWQPPEYSWFPRYALVFDKFTGARYRPHLKLRITYSSPSERFRFTTNSMGFRSRALPQKKAPGAFRVLFVGDSFTEGFGVNDDETFPHYFQQIARKLNPRVEVINAGQNATDLPEYFALMRGYAKRLEPDLVVLSLYAGNDVPIEGPPNPPPRFAMSYGFRVSRAYANRVRGIQLQVLGRPPDGEEAAVVKEMWIVARRPASFGAGADRWLHHRSLFYRLTTEQLLFRLAPARGLLKSIGWIDTIPDKKPMVLGAAKAQMFLKEKQPDVEERTRESLEQLRAIKAICDELGAPLFVQIIPYIPTLPRFEPLWEWLWPQWTDVWEERLGRPPTPKDFDKDLPNERMREMVETLEVPYIDLKPLHKQACRFDEFHQLTFRASLGHFPPDENLFDAGVLLHELIRRGILSDGATSPGEALDALALLWRSEHSAVQLPFFEPPAATIPGAESVLEGFRSGRVVSSLNGIERDPQSHIEEGFFTPVFNVQPDVEKVKQGDFIEYQLELAAQRQRERRTLVLDMCQPATDKRLEKALRQSVFLDGHELWGHAIATQPQGNWRALETQLPFSSKPVRLTVRVEALREFEPAPSGEFPFFLRLRRLRLCSTDSVPQR